MGTTMNKERRGIEVLLQAGAKLTARQLRREFYAAATHADDVLLHRDGTVELRHGFFYTHGGTAADWAKEVVDRLARYGVTAEVLRYADRWYSWPKDSYWQVVVRIAAEA